LSPFVFVSIEFKKYRNYPVFLTFICHGGAEATPNRQILNKLSHNQMMVSYS